MQSFVYLHTVVKLFIFSVELINYNCTTEELLIFMHVQLTVGLRYGNVLE